MSSLVPPGSWLLQGCFYGLAGAILLIADAGLRRASRACGDAPAVSRRRITRFRILAAAWLIVVTAAAGSGALMALAGGPAPFAGIMAGVLVLGVALARSEAGDRLARGLPLAWLVAFQGFRLPLELAMHRAHTEGLMPVQMSYEGLNLDILSGAAALVLGGVMLARPVPAWVVYLWSVAGLGLLANILVVAVLSTPWFAYFGPDRLNVWILRMPYTLLPAVMVLAAWAGHLIVLRALALSPPAASRPGPR